MHKYIGIETKKCLELKIKHSAIGVSGSVLTDTERCLQCVLMGIVFILKGKVFKRLLLVKGFKITEAVCRTSSISCIRLIMTLLTLLTDSVETD